MIGLSLVKETAEVSVSLRTRKTKTLNTTMFNSTDKIPLASWTQPIRMIIISASTLAMVKTHWTRFAQLTLQQLMNVSNTSSTT